MVYLFFTFNITGDIKNLVQINLLNKIKIVAINFQNPRILCSAFYVLSKLLEIKNFTQNTGNRILFEANF